jgi:PKD repeat protein
MNDLTIKKSLMSFKHRCGLITAVLLSVFSLSAHAQYLGGNESGSALYSLMPTACSLTSYPAIFTGGDEDGYSLTGITQASCSAMVMPSIFIGGQEPGYGQTGITQSSCSPVVLPSIFIGGQEDGYSFSWTTQSSCTPAVLPSIFTGGNANTETSLVLNAGCAPLATFSANPTHLCAGDTVVFTDLSQGGPTSWSWSFPGGNPANSTLQNPHVIYSTPGTYNVSLTITSPLGTNSITYTSYISVGTPPTVSLSTLANACVNETPYALSGGSPSGGTYSGPGVSGGMFNPTNAGTGTHIISYSYADLLGCVNSDTALITVYPVYNFTTVHALCNGESYLWHGTNYTTAGTFTDNHSSIHGCDSNYTLTLTVEPIYAFTDNHIMCSGETYTWQGSTYSFPGTYTASYTTVHGCDSIYTLNLSLRPSYNFTENHSMCTGESYLWQGTNYTTAGTYSVSFSSVNGCDSNYTLNLSVYPKYAFTETHSICNGQTYTWHGMSFSTAGTYYANYFTTHGCDSTYTLNLIVYPTYAITNTADICIGESYTWQGMSYSVAGTYTANYLSIHGCDSIYTLHLNVYPKYQFTNSASICDGDTYTWQGNDYTVAGTYTASYTSVHGCDSIYELHLTVNTVDVSLSTNDPVITANASADAYQWLDCDNGYAVISGETSQSFTATNNGNYAVMITQGSCSDTSSCVQILSVGIATQELSGISIYPNPSNGKFTLELNQQALVHVYNALGELLYSEKFEKGTHELSLMLADGVYWVNVINDKGYKNLKLVIQK